MSKVSPRHYGNKLEIGSDPDAPLRVLHQQASLEKLSDEALEALERFTHALIQNAPEQAKAS